MSKLTGTVVDFFLPKQNAATPGGGLVQTSVLVALGVVIVVGIGGVILSPQNTVAILGFCGLALIQLVNTIQAQRAVLKADIVAEKADLVELKADKAAVAVAEVKNVLREESAKTSDALGELDRKSDDIIHVAMATQKTGEAVHLLVNSAMSEALRVGMVALGRIAAMPGATDEDAKAAKQAFRMYQDHLTRQTVVDEAKGKA